MTDRYDQGMRTRRRVLGDAHVDRSLSKATDLDTAFQTLITEAAWGHVWSSDALTLRERSMITLALLAGLGNLEEFELHLRATVRTGATAADVAQVLQHVAIYAGVPRANSAMKLAKAVLAELEDGK
jgi:4-carboxymuconolactone decarboxylase